MVQVAELLGGLRGEIHVVHHSPHEEAAKRLLLGPRPARARRKGEHVARGVEDQHRAHRRSLALRGGDPAIGEIVQAGRVGDGDDRVVLLDDPLVEAVGLLSGEREGGLVDRLLPEALDLEGGAEGGMGKA